MRVGEIANGNGDVSRKAFALPVDGGAACRTEMKGQRVATFGCPHPRRRLTGEGDLLAAEARLVADRGASAALALQAVAHGAASDTGHRISEQPLPRENVTKPFRFGIFIFCSVCASIVSPSAMMPLRFKI